MSPEERAGEGLFLAFQYPIEIPGLTTTNFIKTAVNEARKYRGQEPLDAVSFLKMMKERMKLVKIDQSLLSRSLNEGFTGGEKKRNEIFQMAMLEPKLAILDETDSGLDIDAIPNRCRWCKQIKAEKTMLYWLLRTINVCWIISFLILCMYYIMVAL